MAHDDRGMMRMIMLDRVKCVADSWCTNFGFHRIITVTLIMQTHTHTHELSSNCCLLHNFVHVAIIRSSCTEQDQTRAVHVHLRPIITSQHIVGGRVHVDTYLPLLDEKSIKRTEIYPRPHPPNRFRLPGPTYWLLCCCLAPSHIQP